MRRREFLKTGVAAGLAGGAMLLPWRNKTLSGTLQRPGMHLGHALRDGSFTHAATPRETVPVVIVGGGIAGLATAYYLSRAGFNDYLLLEMEEQYGGNAAWGSSTVSRYPWGAHYLPLPSRESRHVRQMLHDFGILLDGIDDELPRYDEALLVHAPDERLFDGNRWLDGIFPVEGLSLAEREERDRFGATMEHYSTAHGADGRKAFAMPAALSSRDPLYRRLDQLTMGEWLDANGFKGRRLRWYLNYCSRDDFGSEAEQISAWIGIHYFAARAGRGYSAEQGGYLTWPEGLGHLAEQLSRRIHGQRRHAFVHRLQHHGKGIEVHAYLPGSGRAQRLLAERVVWAAPAHIARHAIGAELIADRRQLAIPSAPWVVANLHLEERPREMAHHPLAWDNVIMPGRGLGYVAATHQQMSQASRGATLFTCYDAWSQGGDFAHNRNTLARSSWSQLAGRFLADLRLAHADIDALATHMDIRIWGHAMASPGRGFLSHPARQLAALNGRLLFAHSDAAGYSVFEEASWLGLQAALRVLKG